MLMTRHHEDCRVRDELRRSARTGTPTERRLELARATACTCGAREHEGNNAPIETTSRDRRDNRDPAKVGSEYLNREGAAQWQTNGSSSETAPPHDPRT